MQGPQSPRATDSLKATVELSNVQSLDLMSSSSRKWGSRQKGFHSCRQACPRSEGRGGQVQDEDGLGVEGSHGAGLLSERQGELKTGRSKEGQTGKKMRLFWGQWTVAFLVPQGLPLSYFLPVMATLGGSREKAELGSLSCISGSRLRWWFRWFSDDNRVRDSRGRA